MRVSHFSIGWKNYLAGRTDSKKRNFYSTLGLGLLSGNVENIFDKTIDSSLYQIPISEGSGDFKRLTLDVGLGIDIPITGDLYFYSELRTFIPTSSYPSKYILENNDAPFPILLGGGLRIHF